MTDLPANAIRLPPQLRIVRKEECQGEQPRRVSLKSPVMTNLLRSVGIDPDEWWVGQATEMHRQALRDIEAHSSRAHVRELLLQSLEEYR